MPNAKTSNRSKKPLRDIRVLRNKDPKGTNTSKSKDGIGFTRGKASTGKPKAAKKGLVLDPIEEQVVPLAAPVI